MAEKLYFDKDDVAEILGVHPRTAYMRIQSMNNELKSQGYYAEQGKVPKELFYEKYPYHRKKELTT